MKKKTIILSLTMALMIGIGTTTYAATSTSQTETKSRKKTSFGMGMGKIGHSKGHNILTSLLKEKGITDDEINSALESGKSLYDLAIEKGLTDNEIKEYILNEKIEKIDEAVASGKITAEQGQETKTKIQEKSANWDFTNQGNGKTKGFMKMKHKGKIDTDQQQSTTTSNEDS